jgi:hypothetical protein
MLTMLREAGCDADGRDEQVSGSSWVPFNISLGDVNISLGDVNISLGDAKRRAATRTGATNRAARRCTGRRRRGRCDYRTHLPAFAR